MSEDMRKLIKIVGKALGVILIICLAGFVFIFLHEWRQIRYKISQDKKMYSSWDIMSIDMEGDFGYTNDEIKIKVSHMIDYVEVPIEKIRHEIISELRDDQEKLQNGEEKLSLQEKTECQEYTKGKCDYTVEEYIEYHQRLLKILDEIEAENK